MYHQCKYGIGNTRISVIFDLNLSEIFTWHKEIYLIQIPTNEILLRIKLCHVKIIFQMDSNRNF